MILLLVIYDGTDFLIYGLGNANMFQAVNTLKSLQGLSKEMYAKDGLRGKVLVILMPSEHMEEFSASGGRHVPKDAVTLGSAQLYIGAQDFVAHMEAAREQYKEAIDAGRT